MQANWFDSLIIIRHRDIEISFMHQISRNDHDLLVWQKMDVGEDYSFKRPYTRHQVLRNSSIREGVTDLRTDRRTDGPTDGQTDRPSYRDASEHLKTARKTSNNSQYRELLSWCSTTEWTRILVDFFCSIATPGVSAARRISLSWRARKNSVFLDTQRKLSGFR